MIDPVDFRKFIDLNADFFQRRQISVVPFHRGEPLLHPELFGMLDYAHAQGVSLTNIDTNLSVKIDVQKLIDSPLPGVVVNLGGITAEVHEAVMEFSKFDLVVANLRELLRLSQGNQKSITVKLNPTRKNLHQLAALPDFVESLGGSRSQAHVGKTAFNLPGVASREEIDEFLEAVVGEGMDQHLRFTVDEQRNIRAKRKKCVFLVPTVKWDGKVTICCHDQLSHLDLGNGFTTPLRDILASDRYRAAECAGLNRTIPFCTECN